MCESRRAEKKDRSGHTRPPAPNSGKGKNKHTLGLQFTLKLNLT